MKIRSGFVSNSSSSSFVCIGIDITNKPKLKKKFLEDGDGVDLSDNGRKLLPENTEYNYFGDECGEILGWVLGSGSSEDGSFGCEDVDFDELKKYADDFEKATGIKPKLIGGTYAS